jgi:hypothetical protein
MKETKGVKAFRLFPDGIIQTGGIGESKKTIFEVGGTYKVPGKPELCKNGFHFYKPKNACFGVDLFDFMMGKTVLHEIIAYGKVISDAEKCVCCEIKVGKRIEIEVDEKYNSGKNNLGLHNSGDHNTGYYNSGSYNFGDYNLGNYNYRGYNHGHFNLFHHANEFCCFDKPCTPEIWNKAKLPEFLKFVPDWSLSYKENFQKAWETATKDDKKLLEKLPNFDWETFAYITGVRKGLKNESYK